MVPKRPTTRCPQSHGKPSPKRARFEVATDEFQQLINAMKLLSGFDAVVVTLKDHLNIDPKPTDSQEYFNLFKDMASYVDENYKTNSSRTLVGRGSEGGMILMSLFQESNVSDVFQNFVVTDTPIDFVDHVNAMMINENFPLDKNGVRLHYSFSNNYELVRNTTFINRMEAKNYPWLSLQINEYPNLIFEEAYPTAFSDGLKFIYNK